MNEKVEEMNGLKLKIENYSRTIDLNSENNLAYFFRGWVYEEMGNLITACNDFYQAGLLYSNKGDGEGILRCIKRIRKIDPFSPLIKKLLNKVVG